MLDELFEPPSICSAGHGSDAVRSRRDTGFDTESCRGDDESRGSPLLAHIPTRIEVALATLRLR
jgi:hypothetical protein